METKFEHSVKVPNQYRKASKLLKDTIENRSSLKSLIFAEKHAVISPKKCLNTNFPHSLGIQRMNLKE